MTSHADHRSTTGWTTADHLCAATKTNANLLGTVTNHLEWTTVRGETKGNPGTLQGKTTDLETQGIHAVTHGKCVTDKTVTPDLTRKELGIIIVQCNNSILETIDKITEGIAGEIQETTGTIEKIVEGITGTAEM